MEGGEVGAALILWLGLAVAAALALDVAVTVAILRDPPPADSLRRAQLAWVWLLPLAGAALVAALRREARRPPEPDRSEWRNDPSPPDDHVPVD